MEINAKNENTEATVYNTDYGSSKKTNGKCGILQILWVA
jgi:hypothetical protein